MPVSNSRYARVGDGESRASTGGSSRLAREFTMGAGFHYLNESGNHSMYNKATNIVLPLWY